MSRASKGLEFPVSKQILGIFHIVCKKFFLFGARLPPSTAKTNRAKNHAPAYQ